MSDNNPILNVFEHEDYVIDKGVGKHCWWHGSTYNLTRVSRETAEQMARDPHSRWIKYSDDRLAKDAKVLAEKVLPPAAPAAPAPEAKATDADKTKAPESAATPGPGGGRRGGNKPTEEPPAKE